jgi:DNA-binding response OmpR family regulator
MVKVDDLKETSTPSILVVDDEASLANLYREYLLRSGFDTISFTDPHMAFEHLRQNCSKYSLVITDLRMPGMSGLDLASKIRKLSKIVKIFLITAFELTDLENNSIYKEAKIDEIIKKPVRLSILRHKIDKQIWNNGDDAMITK